MCQGDGLGARVKRKGLEPQDLGREDGYIQRREWAIGGNALLKIVYPWGNWVLEAGCGQGAGNGNSFWVSQMFCS